MPDTSGTVDATATRRIVHFQYVDSNGKPRTDSYDIPIAATDAEINALKAALGPTVNANLWNVGYTNWFATGVGLASEANDLADNSVSDNVVILMKNAANLSFDFFLPSPLESVTLEDGTENVDPSTTEMVAVLAALTALWGGYVPYSYRMSERKKKNRSTRA